MAEGDLCEACEERPAVEKVQVRFYHPEPRAGTFWLCERDLSLAPLGALRKIVMERRKPGGLGRRGREVIDRLPPGELL